MRLVLAAAAALFAVAAQAEDRQSYVPAMARIETVAPEPELAALIGRLTAAVAEGRAGAVDAEIAPDVAAYDCYLDATAPCRRRGAARPAGKSGKAASGPAAPQRLREALCCADIAPAKITPKLRDESLLGFIGAALEPETLGRSPIDPGLLCAPAAPLFDAEAARRIAEAARVDREDLRLAQEALTLREAPRKDAPIVATLPAGAVAPMVTEATQALPSGWSAVAAPDGRLGFTDQLALGDLGASALCFARDTTGRWRISAVAERKS